ncbi:hypothetical protein K440DRAFT_662695 [Wilcoxina mikolae CBS 423.85]|nr:hypothetical protein K440DRAFT_662695 [Wilcoxina mikolae CBS 423.85]
MIASLVLSAIAFVDQAIKIGYSLSQFVREASEVGKQLVNATVRLEAQRYTLQLWEETWRKRANGRGGGDTDEGFIQLWGERGHTLIMECLGQLNIKFGETQRALSTIDPDSLATYALLPLRQIAQSQSAPLAESSESPHLSRSTATAATQTHSTTRTSNRSRPWWKRLSSSTLKARLRALRASSWSGIGTSILTPPEDAEERAELAVKAVQENLGPGTKVKWSLAVKEDLRFLLADIDQWLQRLQTLAVQCEERRRASVDEATETTVENFWEIQGAARALYKAVGSYSCTDSTSPQVDLKLERERTKVEYFDRVFGRIIYVDNHSLKFPLLILDTAAKLRYILLAEAILRPTFKFTARFKEQTLEDIISWMKTDVDGHDTTLPVLTPDSDGAIAHVIHRVVQTARGKVYPEECTFQQFLSAHSSFDPLLSISKRLQLACTICISVLHLYETGWISDKLKSEDIHFYDPLPAIFDEQTAISPFISRTEQEVLGTLVDEMSPFDCLRRSMPPGTLLASHDERLATLFHRVGIILFELGRGEGYEDILLRKGKGKGKEVVTYSLNQDKVVVLEEIEKIPFGKQYRDLVKLCLTGCVYHNSQIGMDSQFHQSVIQTLLQLEKHFDSIIHGDG